ncbi:hypothetical protein JZ751_010823 [Albula glossodonta]|uniref:Uncharacterized protein n=1 Tax=Albula glossodonta TaxID=121402 RepID=A0A8T2NAS0_9TELE|nr:hypothetical protein JZ751_010823 [Albula glossodonta]
MEPVDPGVLRPCGACGPRGAEPVDPGVLRPYGACGPRVTERAAAHLRDFGERELSNEKPGFLRTADR